jgi:hypothetical protein
MLCQGLFEAPRMFPIFIASGKSRVLFGAGSYKLFNLKEINLLLTIPATHIKVADINLKL